MFVIRFALVCWSALGALGLVRQADASQIWDNTAGTWEWNTAANWSGDVVPTSTSGNDALFDASSPSGTPITVTGQTPTARHIAFGSTNDTLTPVAAYAFSDGGSGELRIRSSGFLQNYSDAGSVQTFNVAYTQAGSSTMNPVGGGFTFNGLYTATGSLVISNGPTGGISDKPVFFNGGMAGAGNLSVTGPTPVTVGGTVTRTGTTTINGGTFFMNGTHTGGGAYTVGAAGMLGGTGSIDSAVNLSGNLSPGASAGTLTVASLVLNTGATFGYELNPADTTLGAGVNDLLAITGLLDVSAAAANTVTLNVHNAGGGNFTGQGTWTLMTFGSVNAGSFDPSQIIITGLDTGISGSVAVNGNNTVTLTTVPEPSAVALALLAALGVGSWVIRRK